MLKRLPTKFPKACFVSMGSDVKFASTSSETPEPTNVEFSEIPHTTDNLDDFTKEFLKNRIEVSPLQRFILSAGSSVAALVDPHRPSTFPDQLCAALQILFGYVRKKHINLRHDMIACLGETTGEKAITAILQTLRSTPEGQNILADKPRINTNTVDIATLRGLPDNTFGRAYVKFLDDNKVTPDSRMEVRFMADPELAYVMTRYRESHDLVHTILGMPTHMLGEVAVKWVEALNTGLPMCYGGAVFGAMRLRPKQRQEYVKRYLPWAIANGQKIKPLMGVYWEKRWEQDIDELRKEISIQILV